MGNKKYLWAAVFAVLFATGIAGGFFYFSKKFPRQTAVIREAKQKNPGAGEDMFSLRVYYPMNSRLQMEERKVQRATSQMAVAEAVIGEFLKGPADPALPGVPKDARLRGLYKGNDGILYIDLSDEFRRNFNGDVIAEFLLLKGLYESLISNVQEISDVRVLIEGREMESLGGHLYLIYPLKDVVSSDSADLPGRTGDNESKNNG